MAATQVEKWLDSLPIMDTNDPQDGYYVVDGTFYGYPRIILYIRKVTGETVPGYVIRVHFDGDNEGSVYVNDRGQIERCPLAWASALRSAIGLSGYSGGQESLPDNFELSQIRGKAELVNS